MAKDFKDLYKDLVKLQKAHAKISEKFIREGTLLWTRAVNTNFERESFDGQKWPERKPSRRNPNDRAARKTRRGILIDTGNLRRVATTARIFKDKSVIDIRVRDEAYELYGVAHNEGKGQKKRQFLGYSPQTEKRLYALLQRIVNKLSKEPQ